MKGREGSTRMPHACNLEKNCSAAWGWRASAYMLSSACMVLMWGPRPAASISFTKPCHARTVSRLTRGAGAKLICLWLHSICRMGA